TGMPQTNRRVEPESNSLACSKQRWNLLRHGRGGALMLRSADPRAPSQSVMAKPIPRRNLKILSLPFAMFSRLKSAQIIFIAVSILCSIHTFVKYLPGHRFSIVTAAAALNAFGFVIVFTLKSPLTQSRA